MKKILRILLVVLLLAVTVSAQAPFVADNSGLLLSTEAESLEKQFSQLQEEYGFSVAVVTLDSFDERPIEEVAAECYRVNGYRNDGIMLLISETEGQWYIYASGVCAQAITAGDMEEIGQAMTEDLKAGNYYDAVQTFCQMTTRPICAVFNADAAEAAGIRSQNGFLLVLGMIGGLMVGIILAILLRKKATVSVRRENPLTSGSENNP